MEPSTMPRDVDGVMNTLRTRGNDNMGAGSTLSYKTSLFVIVLLALAVYNAIEVFIKIFQSFRHYRGVYFYALVAASLGIVLHALGYFFRNFNVVDSLPLEIFLVGPGGMMMITGQSIVLYSRLHLISSGTNNYRWLLAMILVDLLVIQVGATTLYAGSQTAHPDAYLKIYRVWERFQVTAFFVQECIISGIYIWRTYRLFSSTSDFRGDDGKRLLIHLILVNVLIIALDVTILAFQYANMYDIQTSWKTLAYSVKLKLEFHILNRLIEATKNGLRTARPSGSRLTGSEGNALSSRAIGSQANATTGQSRFGKLAYARMEDDNVVMMKDVANVVKTTEITIEVEENMDTMSETSTQRLREPVGDFQTGHTRET